MIIGFEIRKQTVNESDVPPGFDTLDIMISVRTQRTSEREQQMDFQFISSGSTAIVVQQTDPGSIYDAIFLDNVQVLLPGEVNIPPIITSIRNDFLPEDQECYTIEITSDDIAGVRDLFSCNDSLGFFCEHTICIEDDDGKLFDCF